MTIKQSVIIAFFILSSVMSQSHALDRYDIIAPLVGSATTLIKDYRVKTGYVLFSKPSMASIAQSALGLMWFIVGITPALKKEMATIPPIDIPHNVSDNAGSVDENVLRNVIRCYLNAASEHRMRSFIKITLAYLCGAYIGEQIGQRIATQQSI